MTMPIDFVLVRHGESEGNLATKKSKEGDKTAFTPEFRNRHNSRLRLTDLGIEQAQIAGAWIRKNLLEESFDRYFVSEYVRAKETAAHLDLPDAVWYPEFYLGEQNIGLLDSLSQDERVERYPEEMAHKKIDPFYSSLLGGESMVQHCLRIDRTLDTNHREFAGKRVIVVCHGKVMWAYRIRIERLSPTRYIKLETSNNPHDKIHNCQILHYSRRDPKTGEIAPYLNWMRSICPTDLSLSSNTWSTIKRRTYTNKELRVQVEKNPRYLDK